MNWKVEIEEYCESKYLRWEHAGKINTVTFSHVEPTTRTAETKHGERLFLDWPVMLHENGNSRAKILSTASKRLMNAIRELDQKSPLAGRKFAIKAIGEDASRQWEITEVHE